MKNDKDATVWSCAAKPNALSILDLPGVVILNTRPVETELDEVEETLDEPMDRSELLVRMVRSLRRQYLSAEDQEWRCYQLVARQYAQHPEFSLLLLRLGFIRGQLFHLLQMHGLYRNGLLPYEAAGLRVGALVLMKPELFYRNLRDELACSLDR